VTKKNRKWLAELFLGSQVTNFGQAIQIQKLQTILDQSSGCEQPL